jgi:hypothetical protein
MKLISIIAIALTALALTACGKNDSFNGIPTQPSITAENTTSTTAPVAPAVQPQVQQAPVVVQQSSDNSLMPALIGAAAGYMLGSSGNRQPQVIEREVVREVPARAFNGVGPRYTPRAPVVQPPKPAAPPAPAFAPPAVPKPVVQPAPVVPAAPKPNFSSGSYSSVKQSAPTYSFSSSSSRRR